MRPALALFVLLACSSRPSLRSETHTVVSGDAKLRVRTMGAGPDTVLAVAPPKLGLETLAGPTLRVVTYEVDGVRTPAQVTADIEAVRQALAVPRIHVLGYGAGGPDALRYVVAQRQRVRSLLLVDSASLEPLRAEAATLALDIFVYFVGDPAAAEAFSTGRVLRMSSSRCGHQPFIQCADDIVPAVGAFLDGVSETGSGR